MDSHASRLESSVTTVGSHSRDVLDRISRRGVGRGGGMDGWLERTGREDENVELVDGSRNSVCVGSGLGCSDAKEG